MKKFMTKWLTLLLAGTLLAAMTGCVEVEIDDNEESAETRASASATLVTTYYPETTVAPPTTIIPETTDSIEMPIDPETTQAPETTKALEATQAPEKTKAPEATQAPETTKAPVTTKAPETTKTPVTTKAPETTKTPVTTQAPETTKVFVTTQAPETTKAPIVDVPVVDNNYFFNDTNNTYDVNAVSIKPRYVYWDNGKLVAECFVINGFAHSVYNIDVESLSFSNGSGLIAEGAFGSLNGLTLAPYTHAIWTFTFSGDAVAAYGADLFTLRCDASTSYRY